MSPRRLSLLDFAISPRKRGFVVALLGVVRDGSAQVALEPHGLHVHQVWHGKRETFFQALMALRRVSSARGSSNQKVLP